MNKILLVITGFLLMFSACTSDKGPKQFVVETDLGNMTFELFDETPGHRDNFIKLGPKRVFMMARYFIEL